MKKSVYLQGLLVFCFILCSVASRASVPGVTIPPKNDTACQGVLTMFTVADTGSLPITYSWQVSSDGGVTWASVKDTLFYTGSATDTLLVTADSSINGDLYRSIATNTDGADTSVSAKLKVNQLPDPGTIAGASRVCKSSSATLSDASSGGVWASSTTTVATIGSSSGVVNGINPGTTTITYTVTNTCGSSTTTSGISVDTVVTAQPITGPTELCKAGAPVTLKNTNVSGSWVWNTSNGNATVSHAGSVTGVSGGTDVISYVFTNGCSIVTSTITVTVDTTLVHGVISGASSVCTGSWIHLSETVAGGIWISGNTAVANVDGLGNVTGVSQGTSVISYYLSNACGASIATDTISVVRPAAKINGLDSVGVGHTRVFSDSATGGTWASNDTSIATIDTFSGVAKGVAVGVTTITYTVTSICGTTSSLLTLYVGLPPVVSGIYGGTGFDSAVCIGSTVALFDSTTGGSGTWSSTNDSFATVDSSGVVTGVGTVHDTVYNIHVGVDTIIYTYTTAFGTSQVMIPIIVNQAPVVSVSGPSIVAIGGNYFFAGRPYYEWTHTPAFLTTPNPANTNLGVWTHSNSTMGEFVAFLPVVILGTFDIQSLGSYVVVLPGTDVITYTVANSCGTKSKTDTISLTLPGGVKPVPTSTSAFSAYPNPTTDGAFTINLSSDVTEQALVTVTNVAGQKVSELTITTNKAYNIKLDQPAGLYLLSASTSTGHYESKITIAK